MPTSDAGAAKARIRFLGTGAAGGTPGRGRSRRLESSLLLEGDTVALIDITRDFERQARKLERVDFVLLTHAHADASGGIPKLRRWWAERDLDPLRVFASRQTISALRRRHKRLDHCEFVPVRDGERRRMRGIGLRALTVPHARERRYPTFAWRLRLRGRTLVYASDVARLTGELERFSRDASMLVIDGAMWKRQLFSHLTIDRELPELCSWSVQHILLTQIGRTVPPHEKLEQQVRRLCRRAQPAYDGLSVELTRPP